MPLSPEIAFKTASNPDHRLRVLQNIWQASGHVSDGDIWQPMTGGRTNLVWLITGRDAPLICKLYPPGADTPLFANNATSEALALRSLAGKDLAPGLIARLETPLGPSVLTTHIQGDMWRADRFSPGEIGTMLDRLHRVSPLQTLPVLPLDARHLRQQCDDMIADLGHAVRDLAALRPELPAVPDAAPVFLHGDPVPGNILVHDKKPKLIDWQCPAIGDACDDLALFLSPAMHAVNDAPPLTRRQESHFLNAYQNRQTIARLQILRPYFHWRMALYCRWKATRGDHAYRAAEALEIARLTQLQQCAKPN